MSTTYGNLARHLQTPEPRLQQLAASDAGILGIVDDLVGLLIDRHVVAVTDLPVEAMRNHLARRPLVADRE